MPSALVAALAAPIREVQSLVGPGWTGDPVTDPAVALGRARDALTNVSAATRHAWDRTNWTGSGADAAADFTASTVAAIERLAARAGQLSTAAGDASAAVARAHERLGGIVDRFEARAQALEPYLDSPGVAEQLMSEAQRSLAEAVAVVEELRGELDEHTTVLATPTQPAHAPTAPAGLASSGMPAMGSGLTGGAAPMSPLPNGGSGSGLGDLAQLMKPDAPATVPEAAAFGDGVAIRLPDGSTATAPNAVAASAVRHALTQLGVPYDWGGTTPGVGPGLQRTHSMGIFRSGTESSAVGAGAGRRRCRGGGRPEAGRPGGVGRPCRDDRRQRPDGRGRRPGASCRRSERTMRVRDFRDSGGRQLDSRMPQR